MRSTIILAALAARQVIAYPWVSSQEGVDAPLLDRRATYTAATCPNNPVHKGAVPYNPKFPYCGAKNGQPANKNGCVNNRVPAVGDVDHYFVAPDYTKDIRGPCPGLNAAANHGFLSRDGITTFTELIDMQQNLYGVGHDLAVLLATLGTVLDGDPVTGRLSIGCDATSRTAPLGLLGPELGLNGHNKFEGDSSLTRNDYFLANGNDYSFNGTLFGMMADVAQGNFDRDAMSKYRKQRYDQSRATNPHFYFGPKSLLLFGASSFLYELMAPGGDLGKPDLATISSFFGAEKNGNQYVFNGRERIPDNWYSRVKPYSIQNVGGEMFAQYKEYPVSFGGNVGLGNFVGFGSSGLDVFFLKNGGKFNGTAQDITCILYQLATENQPSSLQGGLSKIPLVNLVWAASKLNPIFKALGQGLSPCPLNFNGD